MIMNNGMINWQEEILDVEDSIDYLTASLEERDFDKVDSKRILRKVSSIINSLNGIKLMVKEATIGE